MKPAARSTRSELAALALVHGVALPPVWAEEVPPQRVEVTASERAARPGSLRSDIVKTESIGASEIARSNTTNINEAVDNRPGIAVQVECSICNVRNVLLNSLPGRFTTLLIDGVPIYSSVSSAYGLDSVSVWGVERIDVARGAGASLVAPGALSGTVMIVTARPRERELRGRLEWVGFGSRQADAYLGQPFEGGAFVLGANYNRHDSVDGNGDRISEFTGFDRVMGNLGLFLDDLGGFRVRTRLDLTFSANYTRIGNSAILDSAATDYKQISRENPLWVGFDGAYDVTQIWGPMRGRYLYIGLRAQL